MPVSRHTLIILASSALLFSSCGGKPQDKNVVVASVNDSRIFLQELQKELARSAQQRPGSKLTSQDVEDRLRTMIERKLMVQEAIRRGLSEDERFAETIKTYWEQTLIRELIDARNKEWANTLYVTEDEVLREYGRMRYRSVIRAARAKTREAAAVLLEKLRKGAAIKEAEIIGPFLYDDLKYSPLRRAFDMEVNETGMFDHDGEYVVVRVVKKEKYPLPPLAVLRDKIKESLLDQKRQKALSDWVETMKRSSKIRIDKNLLTEATHEQ